MKFTIQIIILTLFSNCVLSLSKIKIMIKDPIDSNKLCDSINVEWNNNKLITINADTGTIFCKSTGYIGLINKEDELSDTEVQSIKKFLKQAKKTLAVGKDFDMSTLSLIDSLWLIKNIYERRDLSPSQHIGIMDRIKKISVSLTEEIIIENEELRKDCLGKDEENQWCRILTLKNKGWEDHQKKEVKKANAEGEKRRTQERFLAEAKEQAHKNTPLLCNNFNIAQQLSLQIIKNQLKNKAKLKEISHTEVNDGKKFSFTYKISMKNKSIEDTSWRVSISKKSCEADLLNGR